MKYCNQQWADITSLTDEERDIFVEHAMSCEYHDNILTRYEGSFLPILQHLFDGAGKDANIAPVTKKDPKYYTFRFTRSTKTGFSIRSIDVPKNRVHAFVSMLILFLAIGVVWVINWQSKHSQKVLAHESNRSAGANSGGPKLENAGDSELQQIQRQIQNRIDILKETGNPKSLPRIFPLPGSITSRYGKGIDPIERDKIRFHSGIDIEGREGDKIISAAAGKIVEAGYFQEDVLLKEYGNLIVIDHENGLVTLYGHLSKIDVQKDMRVEQGQEIGLVGSTGRSSGPHLHFEVQLNKLTINPLTFLRDDLSGTGGPNSSFQLSESSSGHEEDILNQLEQIEKTGDSNFLPNIWPHEGKINNEFGFRRNPFGGRSYEFHPGMDIDGEQGETVIAPANGTVIKAGYTGGYGNLIEIDHENGLTTRYGHLSRIDVQLGDYIKRGDVIGFIGSTGRSTGPHLHYELRLNDESLNPRRFLPPK